MEKKSQEAFALIKEFSLRSAANPSVTETQWKKGDEGLCLIAEPFYLLFAEDFWLLERTGSHFLSAADYGKAALQELWVWGRWEL